MGHNAHEGDVCNYREGNRAMGITVSGLPSVFFGYPSRPAILAETIGTAATEIGRLGIVDTTTWEQLKIGGRVIIDAITAAIDDSTVACFDLTSLNENVFFELGYAIGRGKTVWPVLDQTDKHAYRNYQRMNVLTTVGFVGYENAYDLRDKYSEEMPHSSGAGVFQESIEPNLQPAHGPSIFYVRSPHSTEADRRLTERIYEEETRGFRVAMADPEESSVYTLPWYAQQIYNANAVVIHMSSSRRSEADVHNCRSALVGGLALAMGRHLLIMAEDDYSAPIDYHDLLYPYQTARACISRVSGWLEDNLADPEVERPLDRQPRLRLVVELNSLRLGEHVAENEADTLSNYFIETAEYHDILNRDLSIFIGRKGTGKTANLLMAADELRRDRRNLVCVIKPHGYDLQSVMQLLSSVTNPGQRAHVVDGLWRYLLFGEIARLAAAEIKRRPTPPDPGTPELELLAYVDDPTHRLDEEFAVRLERATQRLHSEIDHSGGIEDHTSAVSDALFGSLLREVQQALAGSLTGKERLFVLVDNLDKGWSKGSDVDELAHVILGLLTAIGPVARTLQRGAKQAGYSLNASLAVFLRSDIYYHVSKVAREPDKLPILKIKWDDPNLLRRVIETRYLATRSPDTDASELWSRFFCDEVRNTPTSEYILERVLPRPRDVIQFCNAAIVAAVNAGHDRVEEEDILRAERTYSQFALEALRVENGVAQEDLERILYEFAGMPATLSSEQVVEACESSGVMGHDTQEIVDYLVRLSFLGREIGGGRFDYVESPDDRLRIDALARRHYESSRSPSRYCIHPAYRAYLEVNED